LQPNTPLKKKDQTAVIVIDDDDDDEGEANPTPKKTKVDQTSLSSETTKNLWGNGDPVK
jgi:hypothetical protein